MKTGKSITIDVYIKDVDDMVSELTIKIKQLRLVNTEWSVLLEHNARGYAVQRTLLT